MVESPYFINRSADSQSLKDGRPLKLIFDFSSAFCTNYIICMAIVKCNSDKITVRTYTHEDIAGKCTSDKFLPIYCRNKTMLSTCNTNCSEIMFLRLTSQSSFR